MGPDVRWVGTESGYGRETEWSVVPANILDQAAIASGSQTSIAFKPTGDMMGSDLGSRSKIQNAKGLVWYPAETDVSIRPGWFYHPAEDNKVKSPEKLLDIYYSSVGRNGVLLLDVRTPAEYDAGHIAGSRNIALGRLDLWVERRELRALDVPVSDLELTVQVQAIGQTLVERGGDGGARLLGEGAGAAVHAFVPFGCVGDGMRGARK